MEMLALTKYTEWICELDKNMHTNIKTLTLTKYIENAYLN